MVLRLGLVSFWRLRAHLTGVLGYRGCFRHLSREREREPFIGYRTKQVYKGAHDEEIQLLELFCEGVYTLSKSELKLLVGFCSARDESQILVGCSHHSSRQRQSSDSTSARAKWSVSSETRSVTPSG